MSYRRQKLHGSGKSLRWIDHLMYDLDEISTKRKRGMDVLKSLYTEHPKSLIRL